MYLEKTLLAAPPLFPEPDAQAAALLSGYSRVLAKVRPLRPRHARSLSADVAALSRTLTAERWEITPDYLAAPGPLSAYLHYFLPWNLWRMVRLFQGLGLTVGGEGRVADIGAGPLTVAQALWMAVPSLRSRPLSVTCLDRSPKPMREGLLLLDALREGHPDPRAWRMDCRTGGPRSRLSHRADLVVCANTLNELPLEDKGHLAERVEETGAALMRMLAPGGRILIIEPGTRRSGRILTLLRQSFLEAGLTPLAPCPHSGPCPFPAEGGRGWCHFTFEAHNAPGWLRTLADKARLTKTQASLSFLYFAADPDRTPGEERWDDPEDGDELDGLEGLEGLDLAGMTGGDAARANEAHGPGAASSGAGRGRARTALGEVPQARMEGGVKDSGPALSGDSASGGTTTETGLVRVLSAPFELPEGLRGRYGCCNRGGALLTWPAHSPVLLHPGDLVRGPGNEAGRDEKSGAVILPLVEDRDRNPGQDGRSAPPARKAPEDKTPAGHSGQDRETGRGEPGGRKEHGRAKDRDPGPGGHRVGRGPGRPGRAGGGRAGRGGRDPVPAGAPAGDHPGKKRRPG
jgi:hypothetical protein